MRVSRYTWEPKNQISEADFMGNGMADHLPRPLSQLLWQRGIRDEKELHEFLNPDSAQLLDPFLMKDMDRAINRLEQAYHAGERIMVLGDYDVDGITSVALVTQYLKRFFSQIIYYIPDRYQEGYGISKKAINEASDENVSLIIALDCGIKSVEMVKYAQEKGIDFIIIDHHLPDEVIPAAKAILNPKQRDCPYPFKELPGCGLGYKLCQAWAIRHPGSLTGPDDFVDLVAMGIAADIVPLIGENRILAKMGLHRLATSPSIGIKALLDLVIEKKTYKVSDVVFTLGPRINAAGRVTHGKEAVELLLAKDAETARKLAENINLRNRERQEIDQAITKEAIDMFETSGHNRQDHAIVLHQENWHKGVLGIVASRLVEKYHKPAIVLCSQDGKATGSARSIQGFDLYQALLKVSDLLEQFGGHTHAAGLTLKTENMDAFRHRFSALANDVIDKDDLIPVIEYDLELPLHIGMEPPFFKALKSLEPFGPMNMNPIFLAKNVWDAGKSRVVGNNHLSLLLKQEGLKKPARAIGFGLGHRITDIPPGKEFHILYSLVEHEFKGQSHIQVNIKDLKVMD